MAACRCCAARAKKQVVGLSLGARAQDAIRKSCLRRAGARHGATSAHAADRRPGGANKSGAKKPSTGYMRALPLRFAQATQAAWCASITRWNLQCRKQQLQAHLQAFRAKEEIDIGALPAAPALMPPLAMQQAAACACCSGRVHLGNNILNVHCWHCQNGYNPPPSDLRIAMLYEGEIEAAASVERAAQLDSAELRRKIRTLEAQLARTFPHELMRRQEAANRYRIAQHMHVVLPQPVKMWRVLQDEVFRGQKTLTIRPSINRRLDNSWQLLHTSEQWRQKFGVDVFKYNDNLQYEVPWSTICGNDELRAQVLRGEGRQTLAQVEELLRSIYWKQETANRLFNAQGQIRPDSTWDLLFFQHEKFLLRNV